MTEEEKELDDKIAKGFLEMLDEARKLLAAEGGLVGLCEHCNGTDRAYVVKGGYTGVQGTKDEDKVIKTVKCFHDAEASDKSLPF